MMEGEVRIAGPFSSPPDFKLGFTRSTVLVTNMRVIVNTHLVYLFFFKWDVHQSIFFKYGLLPARNFVLHRQGRKKGAKAYPKAGGHHDTNPTTREQEHTRWKPDHTEGGAR